MSGTPPPLPDCPSCDADQSLEMERADYKGQIWTRCTVCSKTCLVKEGRVVYPPMSKTDVNGRMLDGP